MNEPGLLESVTSIMSFVCIVTPEGVRMTVIVDVEPVSKVLNERVETEKLCD